MLFYVSDTGDISTANDMIQLDVPADAVAVIHRVWVEQSSEKGDAESEMLDVTISRITGAPTLGTGGTTPTPRPKNNGSAAAGSVARFNATADLSGGTKQILMRRAFNVLNGFEIVYTPEERPVISPSDQLLVKLETAPADIISFNMGLVFEELGG